FIETTAAMAGNTIRNGNQVGLFMEGGMLVAFAGRSSPSSGVAVHDATKGELVAVRSLEGIVALRPGRIIIGRGSSRGAGRRRDLVPRRPGRSPLPGHSHRARPRRNG